MESRTLVVATAVQLPGACNALEFAVDVAAAVVVDVHRIGCGTAFAARLLVRPGEAKVFLRMVTALLRSTSDHRDERAARDLPCDYKVVVGVPLSVCSQHGSW